MNNTVLQRVSRSDRDAFEAAECGPELLRAASMVVAEAAADPQQRALLLASLWPGEGTTTVALGLAVSLVRHYGRRVAVVELNAFRSALGNFPQLEDGPSLMDLLTGAGSTANLNEVVPGLALVPAGPRPFASVGSTLAQALGHTVAGLLQRYDIVLLDGPPLMETSESLVAGNCIPSWLLVVEPGRVTAGQIAQVKERLAHAGIRLRGLILNKQRRIVPRWLQRFTIE
jgi:Mrp family chromosome partitioning ATPase